MTQWVYSFGSGATQGDATMRELLGGKGANLAQMSKIGLPVPPGITITTAVCVHYYNNNKTYPKDLEINVNKAIENLENAIGKKFGNEDNPLLVSVRSGSRASMPGMMDTVLNLGINKAIVESLAKKSNNPRFAYDSYRRFIQMYANVVLGIDNYEFENLIDRKKQENNIVEDLALSAEDLTDLAEQFKDKVKEITGEEFPEDAKQQLWGAIGAVFDSWMTQRAISYRKLNDIPEEWGTAVNIQSMVFGNMGNDCATGVAFTRNPSTGENQLYGEYLINAQGEDVVAGIRTPCPITNKSKTEHSGDLLSMEDAMPDLYNELVKIYQILEQHYRDMQDIEFTIEQNKLWILQTRSGKRTAKASIKIAADMVKEGLISQEEALLRIDPQSIDQLLHPTLDPNAKKTVIAKGLPASPGAAVGKVVFTAEDAVNRAALKEQVILVRVETSPEDINGMNAAQGILTARGGMTSHAAVVARGMGKPCVSGAGDLHIDQDKKIITVHDKIITENDIITINGATGEIILGEIPTIEPNLSGDFTNIMEWADKYKIMQVRTNAETPKDCSSAIRFGAEGIGLCRTEHMFFEGDRITAMREMILSDTLTERQAALKKLLPMQKNDFVEIFRIMQGRPINIRLLDPPLHEFLPHTEEEILEVSQSARVSLEKIRERIRMLKETNPMLGHRGCRLGITYPEIYEMQARAIFLAAQEVIQEKAPKIEIMIPLVFGMKELAFLKKIVINTAKEIEVQAKVTFDYQVGTMIELPRAAIRADEIAQEAEFFSFGTNDLTQTSFGLSRDDSGNFIQEYINNKIVNYDPFVRLDQEGVGELIKIAIAKGQKTRNNIKLGICGEHGGDPKSIEFCHKIGLNYVSCSPYRIPIAKLAAAQASIKYDKKLSSDNRVKAIG